MQVLLNLLIFPFNLLKTWLSYKIDSKKFIKCKIKGKDSNISIKVCDIFQELANAALVVPINTTFDTNVLGIREGKNSIQNQAVKQFYEGNPFLLDDAINEQLNKKIYEYTLVPNKSQKKHKYAIGTVIELRPQNKHLYLLTTSHINEHERAEGSKEEQGEALSEFWYYIKNKSTKTNLVIPLIGTGYARGNITRQESAELIIKSFIEACSSKTFCDNLIIAIYYKDLEHINWIELCSFLEANCKNPNFTEVPSKKSVQKLLSNKTHAVQNLPARLITIKTEVGTGSGILLNNQGLIISCHHNFFNNKTDEQQIITEISIRTALGTWFDIQYSKNLEFCFNEKKYDELKFDDVFLFRLKLDKNSDQLKNLSPLLISNDVNEGDEVTIIAWDNAYDKDLIDRTGKILAIEPATKDHPNRFHIKIDGYPGYSGGGVFKNGQLIGVINYIQTERCNTIIASFVPNYISDYISKEIGANFTFIHNQSDLIVNK